MAMINGIKSSRTIAALGVTAALAVLVTGCSSSFGGATKRSAAAASATDASHAVADGGTFGSAPAAATTAAAAPAASAAAPAANSAPAAGGANPAAPQALLTGRQVIFTADITVRTTDIKAAVEKVSLIATSSGGVVFGEQVSLASKDPSNPGQASATVILKVLPATLTAGGILDTIGKVGTELSRNEHAADVTAQVADVNSRVAAATDSLTRLRELFQHAGNVTDLANVENQIAQREADLESLEAQQRTFKDQTALATITVNLVAAPPVAAAVAPVKKAHVFGFVRGLRNGWHAFTKTASAIATAVGALLPFFVVVLILALSAAIVRRRMTAARRTAPTQTASTDPTS